MLSPYRESVQGCTQGNYQNGSCNSKNAPDYVPSEHVLDSMSSFLEAIRHDPIATVWTLVHTVCTVLLQISIPMYYC